MSDHKLIQESFLNQLYVRGYMDRENYMQAIIDFKLGEDDALETGIEEHCGQREVERQTDAGLDGEEDWDSDGNEADGEDAEKARPIHQYVCLCDCGKEVIKSRAKLQRRYSLHCGCLGTTRGRPRK